MKFSLSCVNAGESPGKPLRFVFTYCCFICGLSEKRRLFEQRQAAETAASAKSTRATSLQRPPPLAKKPEHLRTGSAPSTPSNLNSSSPVIMTSSIIMTPKPPLVHTSSSSLNGKKSLEIVVDPKRQLVVCLCKLTFQKGRRNI